MLDSNIKWWIDIGQVAIDIPTHKRENERHKDVVKPNLKTRRQKSKGTF